MIGRCERRSILAARGQQQEGERTRNTADAEQLLSHKEIPGSGPGQDNGKCTASAASGEVQSECLIAADIAHCHCMSCTAPRSRCLRTCSASGSRLARRCNTVARWVASISCLWDAHGVWELPPCQHPWRRHLMVKQLLRPKP